MKSLILIFNNEQFDHCKKLHNSSEKEFITVYWIKICLNIVKYLYMMIYNSSWEESV